MKERQQFGAVTVMACDSVALERLGLDRPDQTSAAQLSQKAGLKSPQVVYQSGSGAGGLPQTVCTVGSDPVPAGALSDVVQPVSPFSKPPFTKQFGVPMHGTAGNGVEVIVIVHVPVIVRVGLIVYVCEIVLVLQSVHVRDVVGGHVTVGVGETGSPQQTSTSTYPI